MDSITQIVLGAACGEIVLGKKVGNRAMLWGAVGGTIPDLDVIIGNLFMQPVDALAFHRGFMHSILFAVLFPFIQAWPVYKLYDTQLYRNPWYKCFFFSLWLLVIFALAYQINFAGTSEDSYLGLRLFISIFMLVAIGFLLFKRYIRNQPKIESTSYMDWYWLFFWSIFTHPLLDCCTTYGTQIFQPFSDFRVSFNNISVADPLYTLPFLVCLLIASWMGRGLKKRWSWNIAGVAVSSFYLLLTMGNKLFMDNKFEKTMEQAGIGYVRYTTNPTILNNVYWKGIAELDTAYLYADYSLMDKSNYFKNFMIFPKNHDKLKAFEGDKTLETLIWFSDGYYTIDKINDNSYQISDLRYGLITDTFISRDDFVFKFFVERSGDKLILTNDGSPPRGKKMNSVLKRLIARIKGQ